MRLHTLWTGVSSPAPGRRERGERQVLPSSPAPGQRGRGLPMPPDLGEKEREGRCPGAEPTRPRAGSCQPYLPVLWQRGRTHEQSHAVGGRSHGCSATRPCCPGGRRDVSPVCKKGPPTPLRMQLPAATAYAGGPAQPPTRIPRADASAPPSSKLGWGTTPVACVCRGVEQEAARRRPVPPVPSPLHPEDPRTLHLSPEQEGRAGLFAHTRTGLQEGETEAGQRNQEQNLISSF